MNQYHYLFLLLVHLATVSGTCVETEENRNPDCSAVYLDQDSCETYSLYDGCTWSPLPSEEYCPNLCVGNNRTYAENDCSCGECTGTRLECSHYDDEKHICREPYVLGCEWQEDNSVTGSKATGVIVGAAIVVVLALSSVAMGLYIHRLHGEHSHHGPTKEVEVVVIAARGADPSERSLTSNAAEVAQLVVDGDDSQKKETSIRVEVETSIEVETSTAV